MTRRRKLVGHHLVVFVTDYQFGGCLTSLSVTVDKDGKFDLIPHCFGRASMSELHQDIGDAVVVCALKTFAHEYKLERVDILLYSVEASAAFDVGKKQMTMFESRKHGADDGRIAGNIAVVPHFSLGQLLTIKGLTNGVATLMRMCLY